MRVLLILSLILFVSEIQAAGFIETGTMTVQGNAFSVGGSSFVVIGSSVGIRTTSPAAALDVAGSVQIGSGTAKSSFSASGQLKLNAFGVQWADGTASTTASSGGGDSGGLWRQYVTSTTNASVFQSPASLIPADNTIPQISEGLQVLVATITPQSSSNLIIVRGVVNTSENSDACNHGVICVFKGTGSNALACQSALTTGINPYTSTPFYYAETAGSTTQRNYSIRIGCDSANAMGYNNQRSTDPLYGGALLSVLELIEISQ
jgi:hypothetical protein